MRLSIECNGSKAILTASGPNDMAPVAAAKGDKPKIKKERRVSETGIFYETSKSSNCNKEKYDVKSVKKKRQSLSDFFELSSPTSSASRCSDDIRYFGSDELSSSSFSSNSSAYYNDSKIKNKGKMRPNAADMQSSERGKEKKPEAEVKLSRSIAVVEQSCDPYGDFRRSMVEMVMARRSLKDGDLNRLLRCYLSLNPPQHHPVIIKAFTDLFMGSTFH